MGVGSISSVSRVRSLILPDEDEGMGMGMSVGSFSRTAAGNRAYHGSGMAGILGKYGVVLRIKPLLAKAAFASYRYIVVP